MVTAPGSHGHGGRGNELIDHKGHGSADRHGGQTTASLFYSQRDSKPASQFDEAYIQAKLVVVSPELAQELVPRGLSETLQRKLSRISIQLLVKF